MGDTLRFAEQMNLLKMEPRNDLSSTGYALANPGEEYLILEPSETAKPFTVILAPATYAVRWYSVNSRQTADAGKQAVESSGATTFSPPFEAAAPAVLFLKKV